MAKFHFRFVLHRCTNSAIAENEKKEIRRLILADAFREPIPQVAVQMAVLVGSIARFDYPDDWVEVKILRSFFLGHFGLISGHFSCRISNNKSHICLL